MSKKPTFTRSSNVNTLHAMYTVCNDGVYTVCNDGGGDEYLLN